MASTTCCGVLRPTSISWKFEPMVLIIVGEDQWGNRVSPPSLTSCSQPAWSCLPKGVSGFAGALTMAGTCEGLTSSRLAGAQLMYEMQAAARSGYFDLAETWNGVPVAPMAAGWPVGPGGMF